MIVVMRRDAKEEDIQHMVKHVEAAGLKPTVLRGTERTVIAVIGDERNMASIGALESGPGVDEVLPVLALEGELRDGRARSDDAHRRRPSSLMSSR